MTSYLLIMREKDNLDWKLFKEAYFEKETQNNILNLNPGTMGSASIPVIEAIYEACKDNKNPINIYKTGRENLRRIREEANILWPYPNHELAVGGSTTSWCNKLSESFLRLWKGVSENKPIKILTSHHEHKGALLNFENHPFYKVVKIEDQILFNTELFENYLKRNIPNIFLLSQKTWDENLSLPVESCFRIVKNLFPDVINILDCAQIIGIDKIIFNDTDFIVCSGHKWLFGPQGSGFMWIHKNIINKFPRFHYGEIIDPSNKASTFEESGGQSFMIYAGLLEALLLLKKVGQKNVNNRSIELAQKFLNLIENSTLKNIFQIKINNSVILLDWKKTINNLPYEYYNELHNSNIHCKFIKIANKTSPISRLRLGFPYYESEESLGYAANKMVCIMEELLKK